MRGMSAAYVTVVCTFMMLIESGERGMQRDREWESHVAMVLCAANALLIPVALD